MHRRQQAPQAKGVCRINPPQTSSKPELVTPTHHHHAAFPCGNKPSAHTNRVWGAGGVGEPKGRHSTGTGAAATPATCSRGQCFTRTRCGWESAAKCSTFLYLSAAGLANCQPSAALLSSSSPSSPLYRNPSIRDEAQTPCTPPWMLCKSQGWKI